MKACDICLDAKDCTITREECGFDCTACVYYDDLAEVYGCDKCPLDEV